MRNTNQVSVVAVTPALTNAANTFTTLTRADYTLFVCASVVLDTTAKQVNFSTSTNSWKGVPPPQRRNRVEWKGAKRRSTSAVYMYPLRFAGRILRLGCPVRPFSSAWILMFERFFMIRFFSFISKKIEMLFHLYPIYHPCVIRIYATVHHG